MPPWIVGIIILTTPILVLNLTVAICGRSAVFPLSPFFLRQKLTALGRYALHQPRCWWSGHPPLAEAVTRAEGRHHLPRGLLAAVVQVESGGRPHRISPAGAMGPGQLTGATARLLGVNDPFDTDENLEGSAQYLAQQWANFHDLRLVAAAYNAGPGAISGHSVPHNGETEYYVQRVMRAYAEERRQAARSVASRRKAADPPTSQPLPSRQ